MTTSTLNNLHQMFNQSVKEASNIYTILSKFMEKVDKIDVPDDDAHEIDVFIDSLRSSLQYRSLSFEITNFVTLVNMIMMYIVMYIQEREGLSLDVCFYGRRKALTSELTKLLAKSVNSDGNSVSIRDRFGLRGILMNSDIDRAEEDRLIHILYDYTSAILCRTNRKIWASFYKWIESNQRINFLDLAILRAFKEIPFGISHCKDYIRNPKDSGYESLQFTLEVPMYSKVLPGAQLEVQFRSLRMHRNAEDEDSAQSHKSHKDEVVPKEIQDVFIIDDPDDNNIVGLSSDEDIDGIMTPKHLTQRRTLFFP